MINIPEPCNEDFSKMTPTERGAFCSKCQIDTYNFAELSNNEINQILLSSKGQHICGRITNDQLSALNADYLNWRNQKTKTFRSKFLLALILVFGLGLFSCNTEEEKAIIELQAIGFTMEPKEKLPVINEKAEVANPDLFEYLVEEVEPEEIVDYVWTDTIRVLGEVEVVEVLEERIYETAGVMIMGGAAPSISYMTYLEEVVEDTVEESLLPEPIEVDPDYFEATAYPNPTINDTRLALDIKQTGRFEIALYNMSGQLVEQVYSGELTEGRQTFSIDLIEKESGMYLIYVISENQRETLKVQKMDG